MGVESQHSFFQYLHNAEQKPMVEFVVTDENPNTDVAKAQIAALVQNGTPCQLVVLREAFWSFGALLAQYEYKVMRLAYLFNVNAYDQPAVELGKEIMRNFENGTCDDPIIEQLNKFI
jgi:glucose-6-phosphate isomerase